MTRSYGMYMSVQTWEEVRAAHESLPVEQTQRVNIHLFQCSLAVSQIDSPFQHLWGHVAHRTHLETTDHRFIKEITCETLNWIAWTVWVAVCWPHWWSNCPHLPAQALSFLSESWPVQNHWSHMNHLPSLAHSYCSDPGGTRRVYTRLTIRGRGAQWKWKGWGGNKNR